MHWSGPRSILPALLLAAAGCSGTSVMTLPPPPQGQLEPGVAGASQVPLETTVIVPGTPTEVYSLVARGALGCWFGADGPLKPTHVFEAEAQPPANGGAAEIVLYERDESLRDKRGPRALRVDIVSSPPSVRVGITSIRMDPQMAQHMTKDVEVWARGGSGCELRKDLPPPPVKEAAKIKPGLPPGRKR
jgi:hypothetical protein